MMFYSTYKRKTVCPFSISCASICVEKHSILWSDLALILPCTFAFMASILDISLSIDGV